MRVRNKSGRSRTIAPAGGKPIQVEDGESVEVDDDLARSLLEQTDRWSPAGPTNVDTSIPGVLAQVGNDRSRARTALEKERGREGKPRKSLVDALTKIIESEED